MAPGDSAADQIEYSATFEIYPEVILGDISVESVERGTFTLNDVDVDNTIATLRKQRIVFQLVKRAAHNEDQVRIDFSGKLNGASFEGGEAKDFTLVLGAGRMLPDFDPVERRVDVSPFADINDELVQPVLP